MDLFAKTPLPKAAIIPSQLGAGGGESFGFLHISHQTFQKSLGELKNLISSKLLVSVSSQRAGASATSKAKHRFVLRLLFSEFRVMQQISPALY